MSEQEDPKNKNKENLGESKERISKDTKVSLEKEEKFTPKEEETSEKESKVEEQDIEDANAEDSKGESLLLRKRKLRIKNLKLKSRT